MRQAARPKFMEDDMTQDDKSAMKWTLGALFTVLIIGYIAYAAGWMTGS